MKTRLKPKHRAALVAALGPGAADLSTCALSDGALVRLAAGLIVDLRFTLKTANDRRDEAEAELGSLRAQRLADLTALAEALGRPLTHPNDPAAMGALVSDVVMLREQLQADPVAVAKARWKHRARGEAQFMAGFTSGEGAEVFPGADFDETHQGGAV